MTSAIFLAGGVSFVVSLLLTRLIISLAPRVGFVDKPGHRKIHHNPKPLGGGIAIFWTFALALLVGGFAFVHFDLFSHTLEPFRQGLLQQRPLLFAFVAAMFCMHAMGVIDDKRALGPYSKLLTQLIVTAALVVFAEHLAQTTPSLRLRVLTALDGMTGSAIPSIVLTVMWIVAITNAFNFLDNMDGLSSGVAVICAIAFMVTAISIGQTFVAGALAVFIGSVLGFLVWNFPPAGIFMGDSGSLILGFVLGVMTVKTTYLPPGEDLGAGWYAVFVPVVVLALPLYDLIVVSIIRLSRGKSPFVGDTNHFSHRLVARGMSRRTAVLCIYLVTFATSIAAVLLPQVKTTFAAMLIFAQTVLVLGVVALLEQHPLPMPNNSDQNKPTP
jgi:UDP-GlcNAc:undecaprenyl-phosphate/decaprenyl-phosphate GlcNAc-1-phosphate transferase